MVYVSRFLDKGHCYSTFYPCIFSVFYRVAVHQWATSVAPPFFARICGRATSASTSSR